MNSTQPRRRTFKVAAYRGVPVEELLGKSMQELAPMLPCRIRRKIARGNINAVKLERFLNKLRRAKEECPTGAKPKPVRTHYRSMFVLPEMVGSVIAVHNGKVFMVVEIKPDMIGHYLGEFAITYKPVTHGKYGATMSKVTNSKFYRANY